MITFLDKLRILLAAEMRMNQTKTGKEAREEHAAEVLHSFAHFTSELVASLSDGNRNAAVQLANYIHENALEKLPDFETLAELYTEALKATAAIRKVEADDQPCDCLACQRDRAVQSGKSALEELEKLVQNHNGNGKLN